MIHKRISYYKSHLKHDLPAGLVVFLVALPLCLGIAMASGAPMFAGVIAGIIGGLVISLASGSQLSVSGPAAGLTVVVLAAIEQLGSFSAFLVSVVLAGIIQIIMGYLRAGTIGAFFPSSVIKAMLSAIGIILIMKQIPHAVGKDTAFHGDSHFMHDTSISTFEKMFGPMSEIIPGATIISIVALIIMILWAKPFMQRIQFVRIMPSALVAVVWGITYNFFALNFFPSLAVTDEHLVVLPVIHNGSEFINLFSFPDISHLSNPVIYMVAITIALVGSLETLLSLEAVDKLDPLKRIAPTNRELKAQGLGNVISGAIGGLPITAVIVRSSANIDAGGKTKISSFFHGLLLMLSVLFLAQFLNLIPLAALSSILLYIGYKLVNPKLIKNIYDQGMDQFIPFVVTIIAILATDLLEGVAIGVLVGLFFVLRSNFKEAITLHKEDDNYYVLILRKDVSFLNKPLLRKLLRQIPANTTVFIDGSKAQFIDHDIMEAIKDFHSTATDDNIIIKEKFFIELR